MNVEKKRTNRKSQEEVRIGKLEGFNRPISPQKKSKKKKDRFSLIMDRADNIRKTKSLNRKEKRTLEQYRGKTNLAVLENKSPPKKKQKFVQIVEEKKQKNENTQNPPSRKRNVSYYEKYGLNKPKETFYST